MNLKDQRPAKQQMAFPAYDEEHKVTTTISIAKVDKRRSKPTTQLDKRWLMMTTNMKHSEGGDDLKKIEEKS